MQDGRGLRTAVFVSEFRGDLGFSPPLLCVADELARLAAQESCPLRTIFVLSDPVYCGHEVAAHGHMVLPAPSLTRSIELNSSGKSYAHFLATAGFAHERDLTLLVQAWDRVLALTSADLVIADNSPFTCVSARGRLPLVVIGSGFSVPPADLAVFPAMMKEAHAEANQSLMLDTVNKVLRGRNVAGVDRLPEVFAGDRRAVFTVPQLDPYHGRRSDRLLPPCTSFAGPLAPREAPSIFFSLPSTLSNLIKVARGLEQTGASISCYVPGPDTVARTLLSGSGARVFEARPLLTEVLSQATLVLAASADLASSAYLAGRPQLILRGDLETSLVASELESRHTAIALDAANIDKLTDAVRTLMNDSSYEQSAREEARRAQTAMSDNPAEVIARECLDVLRPSPSAH